MPPKKPRSPSPARSLADTIAVGLCGESAAADALSAARDKQARLATANDRLRSLLNTALHGHDGLRSRLNSAVMNSAVALHVGEIPDYDLTAVAHAIRDLRGRLDELAATLDLEDGEQP